MDDNQVRTNVSLDALFSEPIDTGQAAPQEPTPQDPTPAQTQNVQTPARVDDEPEVTGTEFERHLSIFTNPSINEEDKAVRQSVLDLFGGNTIDNSGNILNAKGEVIINADDVANYINDEVLPLDANGNFVDNAGRIIKSANDLAKDNSLVEEVKYAMAQNFGVQYDANVEFPDTTDGLVNLVKETVERKTIGAVREFLDSVPELKSLYQHLAAGGTAENFTTAYVDYSAINVKTLSQDAKIAMIRKSLDAQNNPMAEDLIELISKSSDDEITKATTKALLHLDSKQEQEIADRDQQLRQTRQQEEQATANYWKQVEATVSKGTLGNLVIPAQERKAFFDYMAKPVDKNMNSAEALAAQKDTEEFSLLVSWLRYKGGDISKLVDNLAKTQKVQSLRERANAANRGTINGSGVPRTNTSSNGRSSVSLDSLLG